jgi:hypothetical protein
VGILPESDSFSKCPLLRNNVWIRLRARGWLGIASTSFKDHEHFELPTEELIKRLRKTVEDYDADRSQVASIVTAPVWPERLTNQTIGTGLSCGSLNYVLLEAEAESTYLMSSTSLPISL